jgi:hypothetical protein
MLRIASVTTAKRISAFAATSAASILCAKSYSAGAAAGAPNEWNATKSTFCSWAQPVTVHTSTTTLQLGDGANKKDDIVSGDGNGYDGVGDESNTDKSNNQNTISVHESNQQAQEQVQDSFTQIRPIIQASTRALRLVSTVTMIVLEYKLDHYQHWFNSTMKSAGFDISLFSTGEDFIRQNLEHDVQNSLNNLQEAQRKYAEPEDGSESKNNDNNNGNSNNNNIGTIEQRKKDVHEAAEKLGEAEQKLSEFMHTCDINDTEIARDTNKDTPSSGSVHARAATRLRDLCRRNGGTYIKVGQHIANLDHLLPPDYISILQSLFSDCPITPYSDVREVIREELGHYPEEIFQDFEKDPIASASLAQVHIARDKGTGQKLAIKVQHRGLRETSKGDLLALEYVVKFVDRLFDEFKWGWIVDEIAPNVRDNESLLTDLLTSLTTSLTHSFGIFFC